MGVCEFVAGLADAVASSRGSLSPKQALQVHLLRGMPLYRDLSRLDLWEAAVLALEEERCEVEPATSRLLEAVFEFGRSNLYVVFDTPGTQDYGASLIRMFEARGVPVPTDPDLSRW